MSNTKFLSMIQKEAKPKKPSFLFYSSPGAGKTSLAAHFPGVAFIIDNKEDGINTLKCANQVPADVPVWPAFDKWEDLLSLLDELIANDHPYKYLAFDSLTGFERLLHKHVCDVEYGGDFGEKGFSSFMRGYGTSIPYLIEMLDKLDTLRSQDVGVIFLAHSNVKTFNDPQRESYDRIVADIHPKTYGTIAKWCDVIGFLDYKIYTDEEGGKTKGKGGQYRQINLSHNAVYDAKNRHGITEPVSMGKSGKDAYTNLMQAFKNAMKGDK